MAATASTLRGVGGWGGATTTDSARADGGGLLHQYVELDGVNFLHRPATAVTVDGWIRQQHRDGSPGDIEVTGEVKPDSNIIV